MTITDSSELGENCSLGLRFADFGTALIVDCLIFQLLRSGTLNKIQVNLWGWDEK